MFKQCVVAALCVLASLSLQAKELSFNGVKPAVIIDVRTPQEFAAGHLEGAVNIPHDKIAESIGSVSGLKKDSTVLLYCRSGKRAGLAKETLEKQGFQKVLNAGGLESLEKNLKTCSALQC